MRVRPDIVIRDSSGGIAAVIEVKASKGMGARTAAHYFRKFRDAGVLLGVRYFVLITPDRVYLWDQQHKPIEEDLANQEAIPRYLERLVPSGTHDERSLAYGVLQWLLNTSDRGAASDDPAEQMLEHAGFLAAVKDGSPVLQPAE